MTDPAPAPAPPADPTPALAPTPTPTPEPSPTPAATPPPPPAPPSAGDPLISPDGKLGEGWYLQLGDEFAAKAKDLGKHRDLRSIINELEYNRKNGASYPGEDANPQAVERFRAIANVPEDPGGYGLTPEALGLAEGTTFDSDLAKAVTAAAHATHTPPQSVLAMAKAFQEVFSQRVADAQAQAEKAQAEARNQLVAEWRGDFEANAAKVRHLTTTLAENAGIPYDDPNVPALANNPAFAKIMLQVSQLTAEDRIARPTGYGDLRSPQQKIDEIKAGNDPTWSPLYQSSSEADRLKVYEHIKRLREQIDAV